MLLLVTGLAWVLLRSGRGGVDVPLGSAADLRIWLQDSEPPVLAAALLRILGLAGCAYLGCMVSLGLIAERVRSRGLTALSLRLTPALLRWCVMGSVSSLGLAVGSVVPSLPAAASSPANADPLGEGPPDPIDQTAVMVRLDGGKDDVADPGIATRQATMAKLDPSPSTPTSQPGTTQPVNAAASPATPWAVETAVPPASAVDDAWVVMPGDSFWSIAEEVVAEVGHQPSEHVIADYWHRLIAANRDRLAQPENPDLLFPGQKLIIPEPS